MSSSPYVGRRSARQRSRGKVIQAGLAVLGSLLVATAGLSMLPTHQQRSVVQALCTSMTLGQGSCGYGPIAQVTGTSFPDQCPATRDLDALVPLMVEGRLSVAAGGSLQVWNRSNDTSVVMANQFGLEQLPDVLSGQDRMMHDITGDAALPEAAAWLSESSRLETHGVPKDIHQVQVWRAQRQSLASVGFWLRGATKPQVREPDVLWLNHLGNTAVVPGVQAAAVQHLPDVLYPALGEGLSERIESATGVSWLVYPLLGKQMTGEDIFGSVRVDRDRKGRVHQVIVVTATQQTGGSSVTFSWLTARTDSDRDVVEQWLEELPTLGVTSDFGRGSTSSGVAGEIGNLWGTGAMTLEWEEPGRDVEETAVWWRRSLVQGFRAATDHPQIAHVWRYEPDPAGVGAKRRELFECEGLPL